MHPQHEQPPLSFGVVRVALIGTACVIIALLCYFY
jgi:hypothetical protein